MPSGSKNLIYICSEELLKQSDQNPAVLERSQLRDSIALHSTFVGQASMVHELIKSYKLLENFKVKSPKHCTYDDLRLYHTSSYLDSLKKAAESEDSFVEEEAGLGFDCPTWPGVYDYALTIAGGSIQAAEEIINQSAKVIVNWTGGWHHARAENASGYCYVNDIVLCILTLRRKFQRILYVDLDAHHGDAVEDAFSTTKRVFTVSFHQYESGFYPGTGSIADCGFGTAKGYAANFPYKSGISGDLFKEYFKRTISLIINKYQPEVLVIQCGGDAIVGDPLTETNLLPEDMGHCLDFLLKKNFPTIILGGGGYNIPNTSRYWTYLMSVICNKSIEDDISDDDKYFLSYGPDYEVKISKKNIKDHNTEEYLSLLFQQIQDNLRKYEITAI